MHEKLSDYQKRLMKPPPFPNVGSRDDLSTSIPLKKDHVKSGTGFGSKTWA